MKKVTNRLGLPGPLVRAIEVVSGKYTKGESDITATGLIEPPRIGALKAQFAEQIAEDAADLIYSVVGTSIHQMLEMAGKELTDEGYIVEERFYGDFNGTKIGAQVDLFNTKLGILQDYKNTSVYAVKDGAKEEHAIQLNIGAELLRRAGHEVKALQIVAILRDWSKREYEREVADCKAKGFKCRYPSSQVAIIDVPLIPSAEVVSYINHRVAEHLEARAGKLPQCSDEDRWARPSKWAIVEKGKSRAYRLYDTEEYAIIALEQLDKSKYSIVHRPGESVRCESYCAVKSFCSQYKALKGDK